MILTFKTSSHGWRVHKQKHLAMKFEKQLQSIECSVRPGLFHKQMTRLGCLNGGSWCWSLSHGCHNAFVNYFYAFSFFSKISFPRQTFTLSYCLTSKFLEYTESPFIYFPDWFIINATLFTLVKEQTHLSLLFPDFHSLAAASCLTCAPLSRYIFFGFFPLILGSLPSSPLSHPPFILHLCLISSSTSWASYCQWCGFVAEAPRQMLRLVFEC